MGEDRRISDRRMGSVDRRLDSSSQFQDRMNSNIHNNNKKKYISLTAFVITIITLLIVMIGLVLIVYINLNNKIDDYYYDYLYDDTDYSDDALYDDTDTDFDVYLDDDESYTTPDSNTLETSTNS